MATIASGINMRETNDAGGTLCAQDLTGWLQLAAAPTFGALALLNALVANPADILCSAGHGMASLGGMTLMYALMCVFHLGPWWKLLASWRGKPLRS